MLKLEITFYGNEKYYLYYNEYSYVLTSKRENICRYEVNGDGITVKKMDIVGTYFFLNEAIEQGRNKIISDKK